MRWQHLTWAGVWLGSLATCHCRGSAAPEGKTPATEAQGAPAEGSSPAGEPPATGPASPAEPASPSEGSLAPVADGECETRRGAIESALGEANRCASDAECTLMYPNCPFGCARPVSTSANLDAIRASVDAFKAACNACVYRCMPPEGAPACRAGRCSFGDG
jgi:hypothetical protein